MESIDIMGNIVIPGLITLGFMVLCYLIGSIPTGFIAVKLIKKQDIRETGSGNIGATNVKRVLGTKWFFIIIALDALKGYIPVTILSLSYSEVYPALPVLCGLGALLGHTFTIFLKFKGGKGVATGLGVFLALAPLSVLTSLAVFITLVALFRFISLGSIVAAGLLPVFVFIYGEERYMASVLILAIVGAAFIIYKHKENIHRLIKGKENRFELKKEKPEKEKKKK